MLTDVKSLTHLRLCHMCMRVDMACMHEDSQVALSMADRAAEFKIVGCKEICMHPVAANIILAVASRSVDIVDNAAKVHD